VGVGGGISIKTATYKRRRRALSPVPALEKCPFLSRGRAVFFYDGSTLVLLTGLLEAQLKTPTRSYLIGVVYINLPHFANRLNGA